MATPLDLMRKETELMRVSTAKAELRLRVHVLLDEIERLKEHMAVSEAAEKKLAEEIAEMKKK